MKTDKTVIFLLSCVALAVLALPSAANLIENPSFEVAGSLTSMAEHWEYGNPDSNGGTWGSAARVDWRATDGGFCATIQGTWAGAGDFGGWWQQAAVSEGDLVTISGYFYADTNWTATTQELKIEWYDSILAPVGSQPSVDLSAVSDSWEYKSVQGTAPATAVWARLTVNASGAGANGALQFDEMSLTVIPEPLALTLLTSGFALCLLLRRPIEPS